MKPPRFAYERPASVGDALLLLARHGEDARLLAGGQSLIATLNMRLSSPAILIDIGRLQELRGVRRDAAGLRLGALTRHVEIERDPAIGAGAPLLAEAAGHVAHPAIRNRGTLGGSLALADPAAEYPACLLALGARLVVLGRDGPRTIPAEAFFLGLYETALGADEILAAVEIDAPAPGSRFGFAELARRRGDYAIVGLAAAGRRDGERLTGLRLAFFGAGPTAALARAAMAELEGSTGAGAALERACGALADDLAPFDDLNASAAMRRYLAAGLLRSVTRGMLA